MKRKEQIINKIINEYDVELAGDKDLIYPLKMSLIKINYFKKQNYEFLKEIESDRDEQYANDVFDKFTNNASVPDNITSLMEYFDSKYNIDFIKFPKYLNNIYHIVNSNDNMNDFYNTIMKINTKSIETILENYNPILDKMITDYVIFEWGAGASENNIDEEDCFIKFIIMLKDIMKYYVSDFKYELVMIFMKLIVDFEIYNSYVFQHTHCDGTNLKFNPYDYIAHNNHRKLLVKKDIHDQTMEGFQRFRVFKLIPKNMADKKENLTKWPKKSDYNLERDTYGYLTDLVFCIFYDIFNGKNNIANKTLNRYPLRSSQYYMKQAEISPLWPLSTGSDYINTKMLDDFEYIGMMKRDSIILNGLVSTIVNIADIIKFVNDFYEENYGKYTIWSINDWIKDYCKKNNPTLYKKIYTKGY